jgi:hypothetical protein
MKDYLKDEQSFGDLLQKNQNALNWLTLKNRRENARRIPRLDFLLIPDISKFIIDQPQWTAALTQPVRNPGDDVFFHHLIDLAALPPFARLDDDTNLPQDWLRFARQSLEARFGKLKGRWAAENFLAMWLSRILRVLYHWQKDKDYQVSSEQISPLTQELVHAPEEVRLMHLKHDLPLPSRIQMQRRITLYRFLRRYHTVAGWGDGLRFFSAPIWRLFRFRVVEVEITPKSRLDLRVVSDQDTLIQRLDRLILNHPDVAIVMGADFRKYLLDKNISYSNICPMEDEISLAADTDAILVEPDYDPREAGRWIMHFQNRPVIMLVTSKRIDDIFGISGLSWIYRGLPGPLQRMIFNSAGRRWAVKYMARRQYAVEQEKTMTDRLAFAGSDALRE